jgi:seryl-tRNA synthetase
MLDINLILNNTDDVKAKLESRGFKLNIDLILKFSTERKKLIGIKESLAAEKNKISDKFKKLTSDQDKKNLKSESKKLESDISKNKLLLIDIESQLNKILLEIPNIPSMDTPVGLDESANVVIKTWGATHSSKKDHSELLSKSGLLDFEAGVSVSKSRFTVMKGDIAKLHRALITFMLNTHTSKHEYCEYNVPYIVNESSLIGTGQLPKFKEDLFKIDGEQLYLIPTAEVPLTSIYKNKILSKNELPIKLVAHTPCFRSEAGAYGKDTKGIIRQHQFEKVELVQIVDPKDADDALEAITVHAENIMDVLNIPYQRVILSTADLGFSSLKTYDIEAWFPGQNMYREISSCSNFGDFQSRRLNIKFKEESTGKKSFVNTLNGSGLAVGRTLAALVENNVKDDTITIPKVLHDLTGFKTIKL